MAYLGTARRAVNAPEDETFASAELDLGRRRATMTGP
jgi:hypothetical protein